MTLSKLYCYQELFGGIITQLENRFFSISRIKVYENITPRQRVLVHTL